MKLFILYLAIGLVWVGFSIKNGTLIYTSNGFSKYTNLLINIFSWPVTFGKYLLYKIISKIKQK